MENISARQSGVLSSATIDRGVRGMKARDMCIE
jgi:hypothetical protein